MCTGCVVSMICGAGIRSPTAIRCTSRITTRGSTRSVSRCSRTCSRQRRAADVRVDPPDLESALEEIAELRREIDRLTMLVICGDAAVDDLNIQCKFWRQAAEHAVN